MKAFDIIQNRRSVRTFLEIPLRKATEEYIDDYLDCLNNEVGPLGNKIHLERIEMPPGVKVGTYGMIKNPVGYIAGTTKDGLKPLLDYGYLFEKMILDFSNQRIGTCWMAGTFKRSDFENLMTVDEVIPAVSPIGYFDSTRFFESMMRKMVKADLRKSSDVLFFSDDFNKTIQHDDVLEGVRLAPSASNKQPWRIVVKGDFYHLYLEEDKKYNNALPIKVQYLDMGIAMYHLEYMLSDRGISGKWIIENPNIQVPNENFIYIISYKKIH